MGGECACAVWTLRAPRGTGAGGRARGRGSPFWPGVTTREVRVFEVFNAVLPISLRFFGRIDEFRSDGAKATATKHENKLSCVFIISKQPGVAPSSNLHIQAKPLYQEPPPPTLRFFLVLHAAGAFFHRGYQNLMTTGGCGMACSSYEMFCLL